MEDRRDRQKLRMMPTSSGGNVASHHHVDVSPMRDAQDSKVMLRLWNACLSESGKLVLRAGVKEKFRESALTHVSFQARILR